MCRNKSTSERVYIVYIVYIVNEDIYMYICVCKLSRFHNLPDNTILVTLDVTALYSSIPLNDGIGACKKYLDRRTLSTTSSEDICRLVKYI